MRIGRLQKHNDGATWGTVGSIKNHEAIYIHVWADKRAGGDLWRHLRQAKKRCRKRYRSRDWRGRLAGKRHISERPAEVETRREVGHWEIDTVMGNEHGRNSVVTLVERATGYLVMGKLARHCAADTVARCIELIERQAGRVVTITATSLPRTTHGSAEPTRTRTG